MLFDQRQPVLASPSLHRRGPSHVRDQLESACGLAMSDGYAERLRRIAPGAAGADALLLSGDEQRDLLNVTRERAQVAMLQYALIGRILTATDTLANTTLQKVRDWAEKRIYTADTSALGAHFLEAVQLHTIVSDDLASLLARSSSAHIARGGIPQKSAAAEDWDAGSWRSRMLQSLYGGDPLDRAEGGDLSPWFHFKPGLRFPVPYVDVQVRGPLLSQMLTLARRYDALELKYSGTLSPFGSDGVSDFRLCNNPDTEAGTRQGCCRMKSTTRLEESFVG